MSPLITCPALASSVFLLNESVVESVFVRFIVFQLRLIFKPKWHVWFSFVLSGKKETTTNAKILLCKTQRSCRNVCAVNSDKTILRVVSCDRMGLSVIITSTSTLLVFIICLLWSFQLTVVGPALDAVSACVMDAAHLHIWSWAESGLNIQGVGNKAWRERGKKHGGFWLRRALLVIYGEDPSVLLCSVGSSDAGGRGKILGSRASKRRHQRLTLPPPLPLPKLQTCLGFWRTGFQCLWPSHCLAQTSVFIFTHRKQTQF